MNHERYMSQFKLKITFFPDFCIFWLSCDDDFRSLYTQIINKTKQLSSKQVMTEPGITQVVSTFEIKITFFIELFYSHCMCCSTSLAHHLQIYPCNQYMPTHHKTKQAKNKRASYSQVVLKLWPMFSFSYYRYAKQSTIISEDRHKHTSSKNIEAACPQI